MTDIIRKIGLIYRELEYLSNAEFKQYGLNNNLYVYLVRIVEHPNIIADQLANLVKVDKTTVSRALKKLESLELIEKSYTSANKKNKVLNATSKGKEVYSKILDEHAYSEQRLLSGYSTEEKQSLEKLLDRSEVNINEDWDFVRNGRTRNY